MKKTIYNFLVSVCLTIASSVAAYAQAGSLDSTFDSDGKVTTDIGFGNDIGNAVAMQSDGKIVVAGNSYNGSDYDFIVVRYNSNGALDSTFDSDGKVTTAIGVYDDFGYSVAIQNDGKIVVAGVINDFFQTDFAIVRFNSNGSLDSSFDSDGIVMTAIGLSYDAGFSFAIQNDGKIVMAGFSDNGSNFDFAVVRYNSNGTLDSTFDSDGKVTTDFGIGEDKGFSVAIQSDGKIVQAGYSENGSNIIFAVVRYNSNGALDSTFDWDGKVTTAIGNSSAEGYLVAIQNDGKILVVGNSNNGSNNDFTVVRYNINGTLDSTFDSDGIVITAAGATDDKSFSLAIQSDGKIVVAGFSTNAPKNDITVVRYNNNGTLDSTFDFDGKVTTAIGVYDAVGYSVAIQNDGKIVVAGYSDNGSNYDFAVVRYNADFGAGIAENTIEKNTIKIYPNPFNNVIYIIGGKDKGEVAIFNLVGVEIMKQQTFDKEIKINTEKLLPGLYFLKYTNEGKNENIKLLKL